MGPGPDYMYARIFRLKIRKRFLSLVGSLARKLARLQAIMDARGDVRRRVQARVVRVEADPIALTRPMRALDLVRLCGNVGPRAPIARLRLDRRPTGCVHRRARDYCGTTKKKPRARVGKDYPRDRQDLRMDEDECEVYAAIEMLHRMHRAALVIQRAFRDRPSAFLFV